MRKELNMMLIVVTCAILGIVTAGILNVLYTEGIISSVVGTSLPIENLEFFAFFIWLILGIVIGVARN